METFPTKNFTYSTRYPDSGTRIQMGRSYQFDVPPEAPDQRIFTLRLQGMQYFLASDDSLDRASSPERNMAVLEDFYLTHRKAIEFVFQHPIYGAVTCKFNQPLLIPEGIAAGNGTLPDFEIELIEIP